MIARPSATTTRSMDRLARRNARIAGLGACTRAVSRAAPVRRPARALRALAFAAVLGSAAVSGCRDAGQDRHRAAIELNERVRRALTTGGIQVDGAVTCAAPLPPRTGAATQCVTGLPGDHARLYDVRVRSIGADGPALQIQPARLTVGRDRVEARAIELLSEHPNGYPIRSAHCPADLSGVPGQTLRCQVVLPDGRRNGFTATLEGVSGGFATALFARYTIAQDVLPEQLADKLEQLLRGQEALSAQQRQGARIACRSGLKAFAEATARCILSGPRLIPTEIAVSYRDIDPASRQILMEYETVDPDRAAREDRPPRAETAAPP